MVNTRIKSTMASAGESQAISEVTRPAAASASGKARGVLFIVENLPSPFDRRVWQEATSLAAAGYDVSIICPTGKGYESKKEVIDGIHIYRYALPFEASNKIGYALEYPAALSGIRRHGGRRRLGCGRKQGHEKKAKSRYHPAGMPAEIMAASRASTSATAPSMPPALSQKPPSLP